MAGTGVFAEIIDGDVYKYYSEGEWKKAASGKSVAIINPTTRKTQYRVQGRTHCFFCLCMEVLYQVFRILGEKSLLVRNFVLFCLLVFIALNSLLLLATKL